MCLKIDILICKYYIVKFIQYFLSSLFFYKYFKLRSNHLSSWFLFYLLNAKPKKATIFALSKSITFLFFFFLIVSTKFCIHNLQFWIYQNGMSITKTKKNNLLYKSCYYKLCTNRISILCISWFFFIKKKILSVHGARGDHRLIKLGMR